MNPIDPRDVVALKRDGRPVPEAELRAFVQGYGRGEIGDEVAAAFLMAAYIRGLDTDETLALTRAMVDSGRTLPLAGISPSSGPLNTGASITLTGTGFIGASQVAANGSALASNGNGAAEGIEYRLTIDQLQRFDEPHLPRTRFS